jgi:hypothetical protein
MSHSSSDISRSLLGVVNPDEWAMPSEEIKKWESRKAIYGDYKLGWEEPTIDEAEAPKTEQIFAALALLGTLGGVSWISLNRTAHRRLDSTDAVAGLAVLIALNAIKPGQHWQERHLPGSAHPSLYAGMATELRQQGGLSWNDGQLEAVLQDAERSLANRDLGWVAQHDARGLIARLRLSASEETDKDFTEPDDILGADWAARFQE